MNMQDYLIGRLAKLFKRAHTHYQKHPNPIFEDHPSDIRGSDDVWYLTKHGKLEMARADELTRPVLVRFGDVYKAYFHFNGVWHQIGNTSEPGALGTDLRYLTRYHLRNIKEFYSIANKVAKEKHISVDKAIVYHKQLNQYGYHVIRGAKEIGCNQWEWKRLFKAYLECIQRTHAILVDSEVKINHETINWGIELPAIK